MKPNSGNYAVDVVDRILESAIAAGASDIHIEQQPSGTVSVRLRIAGCLVDKGNILDGTSTNILSRVKSLARLVTYRKDVPQEGRMVLAEHSLEARVGTLPTIHGERAVIRIVNRDANEWRIEQLALSPEYHNALRNALGRSSGVILITGPAGSGKTTTAYAGLRQLLNHVSDPRSLVSLEDPVESEIPGVAQSQIDPATGYGWSDGLNALLRQDPEVMLVGEIRDAETAGVVFQAAMTGQLVLSTLHARSVSDAVRRLLDMDVHAHHICSALELVSCQRLVRKNCECQIGSAVQECDNCKKCGGTGFDGRIVLAEFLPPIEGDLARSILHDGDSNAIAQASHQLGMLSLQEQATRLVDSGTIDSRQWKRFS